MADYGTPTSLPTTSVFNLQEKPSPPRSTLHNGGSSAHSIGRKRIVRPDTNDTTRIGYDGEAERTTRAGRVYDKCFRFGLVRYFLYIVPVGALLAIPISIHATQHPHRRTGGASAFAFSIWLECTWIGLWLSKLAAMALPKLFQACARVVSADTRKYAELLKRLQVPMTLLFWSVFAWASIIIIFRSLDAYPKNTGNWVHYMTLGLVASICSAGALLVEKFFIQLIAVNYHHKRLSARLQASKRAIDLLAQMYERSTHWFPEYSPEFADEDYIIKDTVLRALPGKDQGAVRALQAHIKLLGNVRRRVGSAFGRLGAEITGNAPTRLEQSRQTVAQALETRVSSEALARRLWWSFVCEERDVMTLEDVMDVLGDNRQEEAEKVFAALDRDGNGDIRLEEMVMKIVEVSRERKALIRSGNDVDNAIKTLDNVLLIIVAALIIVIYVAFFRTKWLGQAFALTAPLAAFGFSSQDTVKEFLGSCVFLFIKHPLAIDSRVVVSSTSMVVEQISLLYTVFRRIDNNRAVQIPNTVSNALWIENVTRSQAMKEQLTLAVHAGTSFNDVQALRVEVRNFLTDPENKRDFKPDFQIHVSIAKLTELELRVEIQYKSNWSNEQLRVARRNKFMHAFIAAMRRIPIYGPGASRDLFTPASASESPVTIADTTSERIPHADTIRGRGPSHLSAHSEIVRPSFDGEMREARSRGRRKAGIGPRGEQRIDIDESSAVARSNTRWHLGWRNGRNHGPGRIERV